MKNTSHSAFLALAMLVLVLPAYAVEQSAPSTGKADAKAAQREFEKANMQMHHAMSISSSGDVDKDFVMGMIPHHKGAVAMAETELKYGNDPDIRKLAQDIVDAQKTEIDFMSTWLENHKKK